MIKIKSAKEQEIMRQGGQILARILVELKDVAKPGIKRVDIDTLAKRLCLKYKVKPSFLGYGGYPGAVCISLNNEVVHGLPTEDPLNAGDVVSLDMGVEYGGFHTDSTVSFVCGGIKDEKAERLIKAAEESLYSGVSLIKNGVRLGDISAEIQRVGESYGYGIVRMLVGHGIGTEVHEEPHVPNYGVSGTGPILKTGMTLAIEPMLTEDGSIDVILGDDKWTYFTRTGARAVQCEHTVLVTDDGYEILTES